MKKFIVTTAALLVLAGSTLSVSAATTKKAPSQPTKTDVVPNCPPNDPKGCGIFDN